ncbi:MAG: prepilin-type N-terminal cleavage/methylation domain-containing protein, partial [Deltaproteobacteria bacterium]|nr:prepilin-type N-terminal cleavage/methylation domain-containing protein [Deltaproteobacteria bacterium]
MKRVIRETSRSSGQSGLTLVELLVAMAIGLILLTGIFQVFLGSNSIYRTQDSLSRLQENGRFAIELLTQKVHLAGYPRISVTGNAYTGTAINGTNGAGTASDTLTIDFLNPAGAGLSPPYTFAVDAVNSELDMTDTTGTLPLIDGIESMQILYGEDTIPVPILRSMSTEPRQQLPTGTGLLLCVSACCCTPWKRSLREIWIPGSTTLMGRWLIR